VSKEQIKDQTFEKVDYSEQEIKNSEFENCKFINCNFSNADLAYSVFIDCSFDNCNLSMIKLYNTGLRDVRFLNSKVIGIDFSECTEFNFTISFSSCCLDYTYFHKNSLKKTLFSDCSIKEANFTKSDLSGAVFAQCDFTGTAFHQNNLSGADLRSSENFVINPETNKIKKAKFSRYNIIGLVQKYDIIIE